MSLYTIISLYNDLCHYMRSIALLYDLYRYMRFMSLYTIYCVEQSHNTQDGGRLGATSLCRYLMRIIRHNRRIRTESRPTFRDTGREPAPPPPPIQYFRVLSHTTKYLPLYSITKLVKSGGRSPAALRGASPLASPAPPIECRIVVCHYRTLYSCMLVDV